MACHEPAHVIDLVVFFGHIFSGRLCHAMLRYHYLYQCCKLYI